MNYYYDVVLNYQDRYYMFYEWDEFDALDFIKKIPLFHVDSKTITEMISKIFKVDKDFLNQIDNKTKLKQNRYLRYNCIVSDGKNSLALEFNDDGKIINKSSLMLEDELNINEFIYSVSPSKINIEILDNIIFSKATRQEEKIKKTLKLEIENMYARKEYSKLKYIYLEWFNEILEDIDIMRCNMLNKLNEELTEKEWHIYELIKLSYNNV